MMYRSDLLRASAAAKRLTSIDIEKMTGVSRPTINKILNGDDSGKFELHRLNAIANALSVPMARLFEFAPVSDQAGNLPSVF